MIKNKIYINSIGVTISVTCRDYDYNLLDLTTATVHEFIVKKPDGEEVVWVATVSGTNKEILTYTTIDGDLDCAGSYIIQGLISVGTFTGYSEAFEFKVYDLYE